MILRGKAHKYGDNINTDEIIPARYLNTIDEKVLGAHCLEDLDINFVKKVKPGDFIVAGRNFGCGSSREHAPICIRGAGVAAVIASSYARIFFRNSFNIGLPIMELPEVDKIRDGDELEVDTERGQIKNLTRRETYQTQPFPPFIQELIQAGGLLNYVSQKAVRG